MLSSPPGPPPIAKMANTATCHNSMSLIARRSTQFTSSTRRAKYRQQAITKYWLPLGTWIIRSSPPANDFDTDNEYICYEDYQFLPHSWIFRRRFSIFSSLLYGNWKYLFRTCRIITETDPIYRACISRDLKHVLSLCGQGEASPFDRTENGMTLLHIGVFCIVRLTLLLIYSS